MIMICHYKVGVEGVTTSNSQQQQRLQQDGRFGSTEGDLSSFQHFNLSTTANKSLQQQQIPYKGGSDSSCTTKSPLPPPVPSGLLESHSSRYYYSVSAMTGLELKMLPSFDSNSCNDNDDSQSDIESFTSFDGAALATIHKITPTTPRVMNHCYYHIVQNRTITTRIIIMQRP
jgi:hypothetical protein